MIINPSDRFISHDGWYLQKIIENSNVSEFEKYNSNSLIRIVFDEDKAEYPYPLLSLKNKTIIVDRFKL